MGSWLRTGSPGDRAEEGQGYWPRPSNLIRVMPAQGAKYVAVEKPEVAGRRRGWRRDRAVLCVAAVRPRDPSVVVVDPAPGVGCVVGGWRDAGPGDGGLAGGGAAAQAGALPRCSAGRSSPLRCRPRPWVCRSGLRTEGTPLAVAVDAADRAELDALAAHLARLGREVRPADGARAAAAGAGAGARRPRRPVGARRPGRGQQGAAGRAAGRASERQEPLGRLAGRLEPLGALRPSSRAAGPRWPCGAAPSRLGGRDRRARRRRGAVGRGCLVGRPAPGGCGDGCGPSRARSSGCGLRATALPPPSRTVRAVVSGRPVYLVPRGGCRLVVCATQ